MGAPVVTEETQDGKRLPHGPRIISIAPRAYPFDSTAEFNYNSERPGFLADPLRYPRGFRDGYVDNSGEGFMDLEFQVRLW